MPIRILARIVVLCLFVLSSALTFPSSAQTATRKPPTAAQFAVKNHKPSKKGVRRGTTNSTRWQVAIKNADKQAERARAERKGGK